MQNAILSAQKPDNLLGICHAIGETFGFNPLLLRLVLLTIVMVNAEIALVAYGICGIAVVLARLLTRREAKATRSSALVHA